MQAVKQAAKKGASRGQRRGPAVAMLSLLWLFLKQQEGRTRHTYKREKKAHSAICKKQASSILFFNLLFWNFHVWRLGLLVAAHCRSLKRPLNQLAVDVTDPASWLEKNKKR